MKIEVVFDYASPWAFLAAVLAPERFAGLPLKYTPAYLRGFDAFREGVPYSFAKLAYILQDLARLTKRHGVRMTHPSVFPINGVYALRGALVAEREGAFDEYHRAMFAAAWQEDRNVADPEVVKAVAREIGAPAVADGMNDPATKDALRASTAGAIARGAFGVPTFFVGDQMFWGQDRMLDAARFARGDERRGAPRSCEEAWVYARRWAAAWSRLDVKEVLELFADDVVFTSPLAKQTTGDARVVGKSALAAYWTKAVEPIKAMRFDVRDVAWSPANGLLVIVYERTKDGTRTQCAEQLHLNDDGIVVEGKAFHGA